jgi:cytoskeletal protein CcmA (bactofilin family)
MNTLQRYAATLFVFAVLFAIPQPGNAAVIRVGDTYTHGTEATATGDMYLLGESVAVHGSSTDDLFVIAGTSDVLGPVGGDVFTAGGTVRVSAPVAGDLRVAGGEVYISGDIAEDALVFGGTVIIDEGARIGGDLIIYADYVEMGGTVQGATDIYAGNVVVRGTLEGPARVEVGESLTLEEGGAIGSGLVYRAPNEIMVPSNVSITGDIVYEETTIPDSNEDSSWPGFLFRILVSLLAGVLVLKLFPKFSHEASTRALANNGSVALVGLAVLVSVPILSLLLMFTFLGIVPALFILFAYGAGVVFACALAPVLAGTALATWLKKEDGQRWHWVSLGATALILLTLVPVVGWIVRLLVFLTSLGIISTYLYDHIWKHRKSTDVQSEPEAVTTASADAHEEHTSEKTEEKSEGAEERK